MALIVGLAGCVLVGVVPASAQQATSRLGLINAELEALASRVSPAVVEVLVSGYGPDDPDGDDPNAPIGHQDTQGSGVIVDPDGYIITNYHVVAGAQQIRIVMTPPQAHGPQAPAALRLRPSVLTARLVGYSKPADLAVLKVDAHGLPSLAFANYRHLRQGQLVLAVGSPEGLQNSVSLGLVSSVLRQTDPEDPMVYIQTDAAVNPGNSGGALVDVEGNLVGINASILTQSGGNKGIGFAIPGSIAEFAYRQIRKYGYVRHGYIGASVQAITPRLAEALALPRASADGVLVVDVVPGSPAAHAGLHAYDRVLSIDGAPVDSVPTFAMDIYLRKQDDRVRLGILRGGDELSLVVPVEEVRPGPASLADLAEPAHDMVRKLGIVGVDVDAESAMFLPDLRINSGVAVAATTTSGRADDIGLASGDVIHALNGKPVTTVDGLRAALRGLALGAPGALQVERDGRLMLLTFDRQ